jgi:hypothetical protein
MGDEGATRLVLVAEERAAFKERLARGGGGGGAARGGGAAVPSVDADTLAAAIRAATDGVAPRELAAGRAA